MSDPFSAPLYPQRPNRVWFGLLLFGDAYTPQGEDGRNVEVYGMIELLLLVLGSGVMMLKLDLRTLHAWIIGESKL